QVDHADQRKPVIAPPPPRRRAVGLQSRRLRSRRRPPGCRRAAIGWPAAFARLAGEVLTGNLVLLHNRAHASARSAPRARAGRRAVGPAERAAGSAGRNPATARAAAAWASVGAVSRAAAGGHGRRGTIFGAKISWRRSPARRRRVRRARN